ncbi:MAG: hypothetical protein ACFFD4_32600 [Candidatus Odinarchaeota archaeon]
MKQDLCNLTEYLPCIDNHNPGALKEIIEQQFYSFQETDERK